MQFTLSEVILNNNFFCLFCMWDCANRQISWLMSKPYKIFFIYFDTTFETNFVEEIPHYVILHLLTPLFSHLTHCDFLFGILLKTECF